MSLEVHCPQCQSLLSIAVEHADRQARCPSCHAVFTPSSLAQPETSQASEGVPSVEPTPIGGGLDATNPYAPTSGDVQPTPLPGFTPRQISPEEVFSKSWAVFKDQWLMASVAILVVWVINAGLNIGQNVATQLVGANGDQTVVVATQIILGIVSWVIQIWIQLGQTMVMLDIARGRAVNLGKLFAGGPLLGHAILAMILVSLVIGGIALVVVGIPAAVVGLATQDAQVTVVAAIIAGVVASIPIVIVSLMFSQIQVLIVDRGVSAIDALRLSREITNGNKLTIFLIGILMAAIGFAAAIVGLLALCVGIIPAMIGVSAFGALVLVVAYLCMTGQPVHVPAGKTPPTNAVSPAGLQ